MISIRDQVGNGLLHEQPGDLIVVLEQLRHEHFQRSGSCDLIFEKHLSAAEATSGCNFAIKHLDGRLLHVGFRLLPSRSRCSLKYLKAHVHYPIPPAENTLACQ